MTVAPARAPAPTAGRAPERCTVHVHRVGLTRMPSAEEITVLDVDEHARAAAFAVPDERRRFLASHVALRHALAAHAGIPAAELVYERPAGRPRLAGRSDLEFSLSHSGDLALVAVTRGVPVGVDVEQVRDVDQVALASRVLTPREAASVAAAAPAEQRALFFRHWALTEAYLKAGDDGLAALPGPTFTPAAAIVSPETPGWTVLEFPVGPDYAAAVALAAPGALLIDDTPDRITR